MNSSRSKMSAVTFIVSVGISRRSSGTDSNAARKSVRFCAETCPAIITPNRFLPSVETKQSNGWNSASYFVMSSTQSCTVLYRTLPSLYQIAARQRHDILLHERPIRNIPIIRILPTRVNHRLTCCIMLNRKTNHPIFNFFLP